MIFEINDFEDCLESISKFVQFVFSKKFYKCPLSKIDFIISPDLKISIKIFGVFTEFKKKAPPGPKVAEKGEESHVFKMLGQSLSLD